MTSKQEAALIKSVREKHHPHFAELEAALRKKLPHFDELGIAFAACKLLEGVEADEEMALCDANPGLDRVQ